MKEIAIWLNGDRNYEKGLLLFHAYGHGVYDLNYFTALKNSLSTHRSPEKLLNLLKEIYKQLPKITENESDKLKGKIVTRVRRNAAVTVVSSHAGNLQKKDKLLSELNEQLLDYYRDMGSRWKPNLHNAQTDDERFEIQKVMDRMERDMLKLFDSIEYVTEHGCLPKQIKERKPKSVEANTAKAALDYVNVQKYVTYYQRKIAASKRELVNAEGTEKINRNLDKWELKLNNYKTELAELEKLVKK